MRGAVDGLVLRESVSGENDKLITLLTASKGRITIIAKGARSMKSKNLALGRLFTYGNFEFYEKNGMRWLADGVVSESFIGLNSDIEGFALASYIVDVASEITGEGVEAKGVLRMTLNALYAIERRLYPLETIKGAYELFAAAVSGYEPDLGSCRECGKVYPESPFLDVMNGSLICSECLSRRGGIAPAGSEDIAAANILFPLTPATLASARYVMSADVRRIFSFEIKDENELRDFSRLGEVYLHNHLERGFDTLEFFKSLTKK